MNKPLDKFQIAFAKGEVNIFGEKNNALDKKYQLAYLREQRMAAQPIQQVVRKALSLPANK